MLENQQVKENIGQIREKIEKACADCGRIQPPILLAATKTVPAEQINYAIRECGITCIGENRVQELLEKYDQLDKSAEIHFIGRLQRNKVKYIADKVCLIHSVDSLPLAEEIEKQCARIGKVMNILLEVNTGREEQKGGFFPEKLEEVLPMIGALPHVHVCGLMAVAPVCEKKEEYIKYFEETYQKFIDISSKKLHNISMNILSMGMTDSMQEAIAAGSTMVRIGSAIFGHRTYGNISDETTKND